MLGFFGPTWEVVGAAGFSPGTGPADCTSLAFNGATPYVVYCEGSIGYKVTVMRLTAAQAPAVTTQAVTDIGTTTATGNGNITDLGAPNPTQHGVCWNTTGNPITADSKTVDGPGAEPVLSLLT